MICSIGELLVDVIATEEGDLKDVRLFEKHPGGAPANVAVGIARLGFDSCLVSKVGDDPFGEFLVESLRRENVKTDGIVKDEEKHTGIVFVQLTGVSPSFILYDGVAYFNLRREDINWELINSSRIVHFGSVILARSPSRETVLDVIKRVKTIVSFDVNLRLDLWKNRGEDMLRTIEEAIKLADIVKASEEEVDYLEDNGIEVEGKLITAITMGSKGAKLNGIQVPGYKVNPVDTTGAGDAFTAALLVGIMKVREITNENLEKIGKFANLVAALSTLKRGAWSVPKVEELLKYKEAREILRL
ncbi:carbohydrate kinase family protein [Pyrococcus abyssi]|nr:carbohydrate kinase [Pyrococcus abyssi]CCE70094.1 TPA: fructokinase [Pyrococcus abyssi GE5]